MQMLGEIVVIGSFVMGTEPERLFLIIAQNSQKVNRFFTFFHQKNARSEAEFLKYGFVSKFVCILRFLLE